MNQNTDTAFVVIADALAMAYGTDGTPSVEHWAEGAHLAVVNLIERGFLPPEADPRLSDVSGVSDE